MQAPLYPPATAYVKPVAASYEFGIDMISMKEAWAFPAIRQILAEEAPQLKLIMQASQVQTHVSNWSIRSLKTIDLISADALAKIEKRLASMPVAERPAL